MPTSYFHFHSRQPLHIVAAISTEFGTVNTCWRQGVTQYVFERARGSPSPVTVLTSPVCTRHPLPFSHRVRFPISILNLRYSFLGLFLVISRGLRSVYKRRGYSPDITILHPTIHTVKFTQSLLPANLALSLHHDHGPGTSLCIGLNVSVSRGRLESFGGFSIASTVFSLAKSFYTCSKFVQLGEVDSFLCTYGVGHNELTDTCSLQTTLIRLKKYRNEAEMVGRHRVMVLYSKIHEI